METQANQTIKLSWCRGHSITNVGKVRHNNEDRFLLKSWSDEAILAVVADGMGGNNSGEIAAQIAVDTFDKIITQPLPQEPQEQFELLLKTLQQADEKIRDTAYSSFQTLGMGTTVIASIITPKTCIHAHAGDSRLYHFRDGKIISKTRDHSIVQLLLEVGRIKPEDVATHPMRSTLNSCLGGKNADGTFSIDPKWDDEKPPIIQVEKNDLFLLCSDGLNNLVSDKKMEILIQEQEKYSVNLGQKLVDEAIELGGTDNITILTISLQ